MSNKIKGTVKWFDDSKGFGFVEADNKDYFVHFSSITNVGSDYKTLEQGANIMFIPSKGAKGLQAEMVEIIS